MNISKIVFGWILIALGVSLIAWVLFSTYKIFTGKTEIPSVFSYQISLVSQKETSGSDIQAQMQNIIQEQLKNMIPSDYLPKILNLTVWSIMAFIFLSAGSHIAGIGIKLLNKQE
jgi:hypothetical protein